MVNKKKPYICQQSTKKGQEKRIEGSGCATDTDRQFTKDHNEWCNNDESRMTAGSSVGEKAKRPRTEEPDGVVVQSSGRISKKPKWDYDTYSPPKRAGTTKRSGPKPSVNRVQNEPKKRCGREISHWTTHDKNNFFEGLKEHGRDWKALHAYLKKHNRGKNVAEKSPEHIRQFYYRAWHKVAKYLKCPEGVDRQALEIFGLVCYGEFRKKIGFYKMDPRMGEKLNEMVFKGVTYIRHKKPGTRKITNYAIKTPHCTMLEKLNNLEGIKLHQRRPTAIKLPSQLVVELRPRSNDAWVTVQAISQNPRIRTKVDPERRLSAFIDYMNKKWKSLRLRMKENMNEKERPERELKLHAPPSCNLTTWDVTRLKPTKLNPEVHKNLGLETYMRILENMSSPTVPKAARRTSAKSQNNEQKEPKSESADQIPSIKSESNLFKGSGDSLKVKEKQLSRGCMRQRQNSKSIESLDIKPVPLNENPFSVLGMSNENSTRGSSTNDSSRTSELSSSPESRTKTLKRDSFDSPRLSSVVEKTPSLCVDDTEPAEVNTEVLKKLETVRQGMTRSAAETVTVSDLFLMMGMPDKIVLEYEWVDVVKRPDYLNLGELCNMLRRLVDLARTETTEFGKSKSVSQVMKQDEPGLPCICGAYKSNTPPNAKRGAKRTAKPVTPKASRKTTNNGQLQDGASSPSTSLGHGQVLPQGGVMSPPGVVFPGVTDQVQQPQTNNANTQLPVLQPAPNDGVFKVPVSVAPRPPQSSPITVNNIAQKLSPNALMEQINQANKHTDIFLPPRRQRKNRLRRPMIIQRRILPKPFLSVPVPAYSRDGAFVPAQQPATSSASSHVMKVMNPADMRSVTVKNVVGPQHHLSQVQVLGGSTIESMNPLSSQPSVSENIQGQPLQGVSSSPGKPQSSHVPEATHSGQVPVASLGSFLALNNYTSAATVTSGAPPSVSVSSNENLISQAAMATGIPVDLMPDSQDGFHGNTDGALLGLKNNGDSSSPNNTIGSLLDLSLPAIPDESNDKMLDMALANSNSTFSVSALLEMSGKSNDSSLHKYSSQDFSRLASPSQLSPCKLFKTVTAGSEESWLGGEEFNLSRFLTESPIKKQTAGGSSSHACAERTPQAAATTTVSLISESSRDSVMSKTFDISVVDGTLQSMMNENSLDYMSKFADLAREIGETHQEDKQKSVAS